MAIPILELVLVRTLLLIVLTPALYVAASGFERGKPWASNKEALCFHRIARALFAFFLVYHCWILVYQALISTGLISTEVDGFSYFDDLLSFARFVFYAVLICGGSYILAFVYPSKAWHISESDENKHQTEGK